MLFLIASLIIGVLLFFFGNTVFGQLTLYRRLTKQLFGWDWMWVHWASDYVIRRVKFTNMGEPYVNVLADRIFIREDRYHLMKGDTFQWPEKA